MKSQYKTKNQKYNAYLNWLYYPSSFKFSRATLTASITNAVKVQLVPFIAFSTSSITLFGNLIHWLIKNIMDTMYIMD